MQLLVKYGDYLKLYSHYLIAFPTALDTVRSLSGKEKCLAFLNTCMCVCVCVCAYMSMLTRCALISGRKERGPQLGPALSSYVALPVKRIK